ncbi:MAG TPA: 3D domain-containing protein [Caulobacteraceae bacterium]
MRRLAGPVGALALAILASPASAQTAPAADSDPLGDMIVKALSMMTLPAVPDWRLKATLYHAGAKGVGSLDALGCKPVAMRTAAVDTHQIPKRTVLFIKETVGLQMPDGSKHDGYWYASDTGGAIKGERIDLYTGKGKASMKPLMPFNLSRLSVTKVGVFKGCPPK